MARFARFNCWRVCLAAVNASWKVGSRDLLGVTPTTRPFRAAQMLSCSFLPCSAALNSSSGTIPWGADREIPG